MWATATDLQLSGNVAALLMQCLGELAPSGRAALSMPGERDRAYHQLGQLLA